jgi:hypothetical protein
MSWKERMKEYGGGNFTFLSVDGECITFIVVGEPVMFETIYKKQAQSRIGCPVVTEEGYQLFVTGKRVARKLSKIEQHFSSSAIMAVRHGNEGDVNTRYDVRLLPEPETYAKLAAIRDADFKPEMIQESVDEAKETLGE